MLVHRLTPSNLTPFVRSLCRVTLAIGFASLPAPSQNQLWIHQIGTSLDDSAFAAATDGI
jgi:hypothetical protein